MTDNEIVKAMKCCSTGIYVCDTEACPLKDSVPDTISECRFELVMLALDLINRLQDEKEALIAGQETLQKALVNERKSAASFREKLLKSKKYKYVRHPSRIYTIMDFEDGEILEFYGFPEKPSAVSAGYYLCKGKEDIRLVHCNDLKEISYEEILEEKNAEIERLQSILLRFMDEISMWGNKNNVDTTNFSLIPILESTKESLVKQLEIETIKKFAERLKKKGFADEYYEHEAIVYVDEIDNLVKEMNEPSLLDKKFGGDAE